MTEITAEQREQIEELTWQCLGDGTSIGAIRGYTEDELEAVYNVAYNLYQQRKYDEAEKLFSFLMLNEHNDSRFSIGLGGCFQLQGEYQKAITAYTCAAVIDATNPLPAFHAGECYSALKDWDNVDKAMEAVKTICEITSDEADHKELLSKVAYMSKLVDEQTASSSTIS